MSYTYLHSLLKTHFGYDAFRPYQLQTILPLLEKKDVLAIMPTGAGKSLCFQLAGLALGGTTIVISPLIALMKDQVQALHRRQLTATYINSTLTPNEIAIRGQGLMAGNYRFVYISPERFATSAFHAWCRRAPICLIVIDEAHAVSLWGHDFRAAYQLIGHSLATLYPHTRPPLAAFTATANVKTQKDIINACAFRSPVAIIRAPLFRSNLRLMVKKCLNHNDRILTLLYLLIKHQGQAGIIYVLTRSHARTLTHLLNRLRPNLPSLAYYHGQLAPVVRAQLHHDFFSGKIPVMVATNAFGLGIDHPHLRFVIHAQVSSNLENYFQEIGRAGRDGQPADCYTLFHHRDFYLSAFFARNYPQRRKVNHWRLSQIIRYLKTSTCRQKFILNYFNYPHPQPCHQCDNCRKLKLTYPPIYRQRFQAWENWRQQLACKYRLLPSSILTDVSLCYLSFVSWQQLSDLSVIPGIGTGFNRFRHHFPNQLAFPARK